VILPFTVGVYLLFTHQYNLDPAIALVGYSESTFMKFRHIDEVYGTSLIHTVFIRLLVFGHFGY
jgi:hypothetical protein